MARLTALEEDEGREQRVESAHQHSAGRHVRRFEHGRHEAAVEAQRVRRQRGGLDQVLTEGESVPWRHRPQVQRVVEDRGGSRSESQPRRSRSRRRPARRAALLRPYNAPEGSGHGQGRTRGRELRTPTLAKAQSGVRALEPAPGDPQLQVPRRRYCRIRPVRERVAAVPRDHGEAYRRRHQELSDSRSAGEEFQ